MYKQYMPSILLLLLFYSHGVKAKIIRPKHDIFLAVDSKLLGRVAALRRLSMFSIVVVEKKIAIRFNKFFK